MPHLESFAGLGPYNSKRLLEVIVLVYLALLSTIQVSEQRPPSRILIQAFSIIFILGLVSSLVSTNPVWGIVEVVLFFLMVIGIHSIGSIYQENPVFHSKAIIVTISMTALAYLPVFLAGYLAVIVEGIPKMDADLFGTFSNIRFFNQFLTWTLPLLPLAIILSTPKNRTKVKLLTYTIMGFWWCMAIVSGSRGSMLGLAIGSFTVLLIFRRNAVQWAKYLFIGLIIGSMVYAVLTYLIPFIMGNNDALQVYYRSLTNNANMRVDIWVDALMQLKSSLLLGIGPMQLACDSANIREVSHPHNSLVQIVVEWGIPTALLFFVICTTVFFKWIRRASMLLAQGTTPQMIPVALTASLVSAGVHSLFSGIIVMPTSQLLLVLNVGWIVGIYSASSIESTSAVKVLEINFYRVATVATVIYITLFVLSEVYSLNISNEYSTGEVSPHSLLKPRFWQQGDICKS